MKKVLISVAAAGLMMGQVAAAHAVTFAQFFGGSTSFASLFNYNTAGNQIPQGTTSAAWNTAVLGTVTQSGTLASVAEVSVPLNSFQYVDPSWPHVAGTPFGVISMASLKFEIVTNEIATQSGASDQQNFDTMSLSITAGGKNLLTVTDTVLVGGFNAGILSGNQGGNSAGVSGADVPGSTATESKVTFTSDYLLFNGVTNKTYSLAFSNLFSGKNGLTFESNGPFTGWLDQFTANLAGTFSGQPTSVPEPGAVSMLMGCGISGSLLLRRRRR
jgi:hypothetical protein